MPFVWRKSAQIHRLQIWLQPFLTYDLVQVTENAASLSFSFSFFAFPFLKALMRASLMVQWLRIHLPMQGTWV